jgi:hypothetical protein
MIIKIVRIIMSVRVILGRRKERLVWVGLVKIGGNGRLWRRWGRVRRKLRVCLRKRYLGKHRMM